MRSGRHSAGFYLNNVQCLCLHFQTTLQEQDVVFECHRWTSPRCSPSLSKARRTPQHVVHLGALCLSLSLSLSLLFLSLSLCTLYKIQLVARLVPSATYQQVVREELVDRPLCAGAARLYDRVCNAEEEAKLFCETSQDTEKLIVQATDVCCPASMLEVYS